MKKRFIVLIDFSEHSGNLIRYASEWGRQTGAELLLVHQNTVVFPGYTDAEIKESAIKQANEEVLLKLKVLAAPLTEKSSGVSYLVSERHLQLILSDLLSEPYDNLIFTGIKETSLLKKMFLGSVAMKVINETDNIVVAMPVEISDYSHEKVYVAVSEKHPLNTLELNRFLNFISPENTCITFFSLAKPGEKIRGIEKQLNLLADLFSGRYKTKVEIYAGSNPFEDIKKVINHKEKEILVVQRGSRLLADQLFRRFLINELVYDGRTPLIVLP